MSFTTPFWLWCMPFIGVLLLLGWQWTDRRQRAALGRFVAPQLAQQLTQSVSRFRRWLQRGFLLLALLALCAALAGPLVGFQWQTVNRRGNQIMFALDTSRSMLTPDLRPSRLIRAKLAIDDLARQLDGNAMGIVAFAGTAFLACPITFDLGAFRESLGAIDTHTVPRGGTDVSSAIRSAGDALARRPGTDKILILVTDGEDLEGHALDAARAAAQQGIKIFTVGVGSGAGELIPLPASEGGGFVKDENGEFVRSRLDESGLKAIAAATGGLYVALGTGSDVDAALKLALDALAKQDLASRQQRVYTPRFQWPLCVALCSLTLSLLINTRRRSRGRALATSAAAASVLLLVGLPLQRMRAAEPEAPPGDEPIRTYNAGTAAYKAGQYPQAGKAFERSIREAPAGTAQRLADQQDAYYNLGNAWYRAGQATAKSSKEDTLKAWNAAVKAYETALQMRPDDEDSRYNRDLVKKKIAALNQPDPPPQGGGGGGGGGQGQPPPGSPPPSGQPPPGQPPPGQPPPAQQQPPPGQPAQQPPTAAQPPPPPKTDPGQEAPPPRGTPQPAASAASPDPANGTSDESGAAREPGQMSRAEAQQLLDSAKSDEKHTLSAPDYSDDYHPPADKPYRNW